MSQPPRPESNRYRHNGTHSSNGKHPPNGNQPPTAEQEKPGIEGVEPGMMAMVIATGIMLWVATFTLARWIIRLLSGRKS